MKKIFLYILILALVESCSKPQYFLVKSVLDSQTLELEDGTIVKLIGVNQYTQKYVDALNHLSNNYVYLYDENYDPIDYIDQGSIMAYVYDEEGNCINDFATGDSELTIASTISPHDREIVNDTEIKERISGSIINEMPASTLSELYERHKNAVFLIAVPQDESTYAQGTGFFISSTGIGVSNYHVFESGIQEQAVIKTIDNLQYNVKRIIDYNAELDYIVFEVENEHNDFPYLKFALTESGVGEEVFAIGNPRGLEHTLSKGIVSSYRKNNSLIQTTTEITHGSSGGPLFNMKGEVIGITTSGVGEANLNFAMNVLRLNLSNNLAY